MRDVIWQKVVEKKESVSAVSAELGVDMRRIGAVVRLKTVEKNWEKEASPFIIYDNIGGRFMMINFKKSISLEDTHMVTKFSFASLSDYAHHIQILERFWKSGHQLT